MLRAVQILAIGLAVSVLTNALFLVEIERHRYARKAETKAQPEPELEWRPVYSSIEGAHRRMQEDAMRQR